jgi:proteasome alpha subunit
MPIYASPEQFMRDRSDYARKGIARGRSVVTVIFSGGVLFVAENPSPTLHKVSEIYDRIGFAGTGRYNEYENLRTAGIRLADVRGYSYDRGDVTGRWLANAYAQTLGSVFSEHSKPMEVELCVAEVGPPGGPTDGTADQLYRISYDGSMYDEPRFVVMGGVTEPISAALEASFTDGWDLTTALRACVSALAAAPDGSTRAMSADQLEVAVLDRRLLGRTFRRIDDREVAVVLAAEAVTTEADPAGPADVDPSVPVEGDAEPAAPDENGAGDPQGGQE